MPECLTDRYATDMDGVLSCYDRIVLTGTLTGVGHPRGMTGWLYGNGIRVFDFPDTMNEVRLRLRDHAKRIADEGGVEIEFIRNIKAFRKEARIKEILVERGNHPGLVHVFSAMETCKTFEPWHDKKTHKTYLRATSGKCLHFYFYLMDEEFGLCYLRVPTWAPFRLQFYCNGHNWLAAALRNEGIGFTQIENAFAHVDNWERAQEISDAFPADRLHRHCDRLAHRFCPVLDLFDSTYHWSIMQCEYASDLAFRDSGVLGPLYDTLSRAAVCAVKAPDVAMFLGRKLSGNYRGELGSRFHTRVEGTCIRHHMGPAAVKLYDKHGHILRIETTCNDVTFFKHYRTVEHRDGTREKKYAPARKTVYSLGPLREILGAVNRRYLKYISELTDSSGGIREAERLSKTVAHNGRRYTGFNLFKTADLDLFLALADGEHAVAGIGNKRIRKKLPSWSSSRASRMLKKLRLHGLIKRIARTYRYYLTERGRRLVLTALKLRELVVIPSLANVH